MPSAEFEAAAQAVQNLPSKPNDQEMLKLYGLYKQATVGDNTSEKPGLLDFKGKMKWQAWEDRKGLSQADAESEYIAYVKELQQNRHCPGLKALIVARNSPPPSPKPAPMVLRFCPGLYWNCSEQRCMRGCCVCLFWTPRFVVPLAVVWGTLSHAVYASGISSAVVRLPVLLLGVLAGVTAFVAYYRVWSVGPGSPVEYKEFTVDPDFSFEAEDAEEAAPLVLQQAVEAKHDGGIRFCNKCLCFKPDRTHHCRHCGICVLRMDHHCPWFSTCVGLRNHKFFVQFLWYVFVLCVMAEAVALPRVYSYFKEEQYLEDFIGVNFSLYFVLASTFVIILAAFGTYTTWLLVKNCTTLETMEPQPYRTSLPASQWRYRQPPDRQTLGNIYDVGKINNISQIMGNTWLEWLLPIRPKSQIDGTHFPINESLVVKAEERAQTEIALHRRKQQWLEAQSRAAA